MAQEYKLELSTQKSTSTLMKSVFTVLKEAHNLYAEHRVKQFLYTINSEIENLSVEHQSEINEFLSDKGTKKVLSDYAAAITNTSSEIALRALALLFIDDRQFNFTSSEKARFISCISGMDDLKVNLFIRLSTLQNIDFKAIYPIYVIHNQNYAGLDLGVDVDELFAYSEDFINRGLLLRDPRSDLGSNFYAPKDGDWSICFGISPTLQRYASLLRKAKVLASK